MANHIPPSLSWLIKKRAHIAGEILHTRKALIKVQKLVDKLKRLEEDLATIDKSLDLHEIKVDLNNIKPVRPRRQPLKMPYGYISDFVIDYLRQHARDKYVEKIAIVEALIKKYEEINQGLLDLPPYVDFTDAVSQALYGHVRHNRVVRHHNKNQNKMGLWQISNNHLD
jgi:hypothetical protein